MTTRPDYSSAVEDRQDPLADWHLGKLDPIPTMMPDGWQLIRLTSVARLESGHTPSRRCPEYWSGGEIPWVSLHDSDALDVPELHTTAQSITSLGLAHSSARLLPKGTVVFSRTATVGKSTVLGREMTTSQDFANFICGPRLHNFYLMHLFRFMSPEWKRLMAGSTHNSIYMPVFRDLQILLPPTVAEQEAIAEALSDADALIASLEQLLAKKRQIKQGSMRELLTGRRRLMRHTGAQCRRQARIGCLPADWEVVAIGKAGEVLGGRQRSPGREGDLCKYLRVANVFDGFIDTSDVIEMPFTQSERSRFLLRDGDILLNEGQSIELVGRSAIYRGIPEDCCFQNTLLRFRASQSTCVEFAQYMFQHYLHNGVFAAIALQTTSIAHLGAGRFASLDMPLPPRPEQEAIAAVLSDMDAEIGSVEAKLAKTRQIKQGMMQELLTGRIRLV